MALPDFFVIGAPKAGTTALHVALSEHPSVFMSPVKEPKFFLCDGPPPRSGGPGDAHSYREWIWRQHDYEALFDAATAGALRGESTPFYLSDLSSHDRIHRLAPNARLIALLRDPVDRAYSNWAHLWADGLEPISDFVQACAAEPERLAAGWAPFWRYRSTGLYGEQLTHLLSVFPREQVLLLRYKYLVDEPRAALDDVCGFLGIEQGVLADIPPHNVGTYVPPTVYDRSLRRIFRVGAALGSNFPPEVWRRASVPLLWLIQRRPEHRPELSEEARAALTEYFADDVAVVEQLTGWDLGEWLSHRQGSTYSVRRSWAPSRRVAS
jgi:hypothetical protein